MQTHRRSRIKTKTAVWGALIPIVLALSSLAFAIYLYRDMQRHYVISVAVYRLLMVLPCLCYAIIALLCLLKRIRPAVTLGVSFVLIPLCALLLGYGGYVAERGNDTAIIDDPAAFDQAMRVYAQCDSELPDAFPRELPANARDIHFRYEGGFYLEGPRFLIDYQLSPEEVEAVRVQASQLAAWTGDEASARAINSLYSVFGEAYLRDTDYDENTYLYLMESPYGIKSIYTVQNLHYIAINEADQRVYYYAQKGWEFTTVDEAIPNE